MYFQMQDGISLLELKDVKPGKLTIGIITMEELEQCYPLFGFSEATVTECKSVTQHSHGNLDIYNDYLFGIIFGINASHIIKVQDRIGIYIKKNLFLIVIIEDQDDSIKNNLLESLEHMNKSKISLERLIYGFFERMISSDYELLEKIEVKISSHEDKIDERAPDKDFNRKITAIRKKLLLLDNYYQQLIAIGEELEENEADIFDEKNIHYFRIFHDRVTRLSNNTRMLQEYSVQVREAYHAQLDNDLNKIMKLFTVFTTVFMPLTLIAGWYGMNFTTMPELTWKYGYLYVIILSLSVAFFCILYFRKKKFL